jgi:hypothetical protein
MTANNLRENIIDETARQMIANGGNVVAALQTACAAIEGANAFLNDCTARETAAILCAVGDRYHADRMQTFPTVAEALPGRKTYRLVLIPAEEGAPVFVPLFHAAHDTDGAAQTAARLLIAAELARTGRTFGRAELYSADTTPYRRIDFLYRP